MKPLLMRHTEPINESFKLWRNGNPYLHNPWHYHPECELTYVLHGSGSLFIGDEVTSYNDGELVIIGPNLPHEYRSNIKEFPDNYSESLSVHFDLHFLGKNFYNLAEAKVLNDFLFLAARGISIQDESVKKSLRSVLEKLFISNGLPKICLILELFHLLTQSKQNRIFSSRSFAGSIERTDDNRINEVYQYVMKNFTRNVTIHEAASLINMTSTSFCRFFKDRTHKSFIQYVTEVRVGYACRLLLAGEMPIAQIAYSSGFNNLSHFNKQFKLLKNQTPTQFIENYTCAD